MASSISGRTVVEGKQQFRANSSSGRTVVVPVRRRVAHGHERCVHSGAAVLRRGLAGGSHDARCRERAGVPVEGEEEELVEGEQ